jgi:hypothetical protein
MDGREELGDISATPPVAAAFSSSLMTIDQDKEEPEPEERRGGTTLFALGLSIRAGRERERRREGGATLEAGEASRTGQRSSGGGENGRGWKRLMAG